MRTNTQLKQYLNTIKKSIKDAAIELSLSRPYLTTIANGASCGKETARRIEKWSNGKVSRDRLMFPEERAKI